MFDQTGEQDLFASNNTATAANAAFEADFSVAVETDPQADFLAREAAAMQALGVDASSVVQPNLVPSAAPIAWEASVNSTAPAIVPTSSFSQAASPSLESPAITAWRTQFEARIKERDENSEAKHGKTLERAQADLAQFYETYREKKAKAAARNLQEQEEFIRQRDADPHGHRWEQIHRQIDTVQKPKGSRDTTRLKSILTSVKNDPNAPGNE